MPSSAAARHLSCRGAEQRVHAAGRAARAGGHEPRLLFRLRSHDAPARVSHRNRRATAVRDGARDTGRHAILAQHTADRDRLLRVAAERVEEHRQVAARGLVQKFAEMPVGVRIKISFRRDPCAAARTAGIGLAVRDKEDQRLLLDLGENRLLAGLGGRRPARRRRVSLACGKQNEQEQEIAGDHFAFQSVVVPGPYQVATCTAIL